MLREIWCPICAACRERLGLYLESDGDDLKVAEGLRRLIDELGEDGARRLVEYLLRAGPEGQVDFYDVERTAPAAESVTGERGGQLKFGY